MKKVLQIPSCEMCKTNSLLTSSLTKEETELLTYQKNCNTYKRGDTIYQEGNRTGGVFCLNSGIVKIYKTGTDGKEQIIRFAKKGDLFGYRSVLSDESASTGCKVLEEAKVCFIPSSYFLELIQNSSSFSRKIMKQTCRELGDANKFILDIAQKSVRERLAEVLLLLNDIFHTDTKGAIEIKLTREELANIVGTATESVIRLLSEFKADGLISINRREIKLLDIQKLRRISNDF